MQASLPHYFSQSQYPFTRTYTTSTDNYSPIQCRILNQRSLAQTDGDDGDDAHDDGEYHGDGDDAHDTLPHDFDDVVIEISGWSALMMNCCSAKLLLLDDGLHDAESRQSQEHYDSESIGIQHEYKDFMEKTETTQD